MSTACPAPEELSRAVSEGAPAEMAEHLASCDACGLEWASANELRALARTLPFEPPAPDRVLSVRARVVERAAAVRRRGLARGGLYVGLAIAALAVLAIGLRRPARAPIATEAAPRYHGAVVALNGARWTRQSAAPDEVVRLESGTIHVEVTPLGPGERFRVRAGDGEVEVRGTAFDVDVEAGHMARVEVAHGRVEVRGAGADAAVLTAGEKWRAGEAVRSPDVPPAASESAAAEISSAALPARVAAPSVAHPSPSGSKPSLPGSVSPAVQGPALTERTADVPPLPSPSVVAPNPSPVAPKMPPPPETAPASSDDRAHEEDRRERRDERRERQDQRRWR